VRAPNRYVVDVTPDDDARMAAFAQKWRYHLRKSLKEGLEFERNAFYLLFGTEDQKEGVRAFLEKREPRWRGR